MTELELDLTPLLGGTDGGPTSEPLLGSGLWVPCEPFEFPPFPLLGRLEPTCEPLLGGDGTGLCEPFEFPPFPLLA